MTGVVGHGVKQGIYDRSVIQTDGMLDALLDLNLDCIRYSLTFCKPGSESSICITSVVWCIVRKEC